MRRIIRRTVTVTLVQTYTFTCEDQAPTPGEALEPAARPPAPARVDFPLPEEAPARAMPALVEPEAPAANDNAS